MTPKRHDMRKQPKWIQLKDHLLRESNRKLREELDELEAKQRLFEYTKSKGRNSFPFSYGD